MTNKDVRYVTTPVMQRMLAGTVQAVPRLDPEGKHVLVFSMLHNDIEVRGLWMLKVPGTMEPVERLLTVPVGNFNQAMEQARETGS